MNNKALDYCEPIMHRYYPELTIVSIVDLSEQYHMVVAVVKTIKERGCTYIVDKKRKVARAFIPTEIGDPKIYLDACNNRTVYDNRKEFGGS